MTRGYVWWDYGPQVKESQKYERISEEIQSSSADTLRGKQILKHKGWGEVNIILRRAEGRFQRRANQLHDWVHTDLLCLITCRRLPGKLQINKRSQGGVKESPAPARTIHNLFNSWRKSLMRPPCPPGFAGFGFFSLSFARKADVSLKEEKVGQSTVSLVTAKCCSPYEKREFGGEVFHIPFPIVWVKMQKRWLLALAQRAE